MRYEAKNKYFKKIAVSLGNFKNIGKTVATRHQRYMCYKTTCGTFFGENTAYGSGNNTVILTSEKRADSFMNFTVTSILVKPVAVGDVEYSGALLEARENLVTSTTVHRYVTV